MPIVPICTGCILPNKIKIKKKILINHYYLKMSASVNLISRQWFITTLLYHCITGVPIERAGRSRR